MDVRILSVPWDAGHRDERMGRGPAALIRGGLVKGLTERGHDVEVEIVGPHVDDPADEFLTEIATSFDLWSALRERVAAAREDGRFPVLLTGNCGAALGVVGGLEAERGAGAHDLAVVWMDAHGDFNTPETSRSGFLDGMSLATLVGRCWRALTLRAPGFAVPEHHVLHLGGRDFDPAEKGLFAASGIRCFGLKDLRRGRYLPAHLEWLSGVVTRLYLHVDLDVLDPRVAPANGFVAIPRNAEEAEGWPADTRVDGLTADELVALASQVCEHIRPDALTLSAYDPAADPDGHMPPIALRLVAAVLDAASKH